MPHIELKLRVPPHDLAKLRDHFFAAGFCESAIAERLGLWDISLLNAKQLPHYIWLCQQEKSTLSTLILVFLLRQGVKRADLNKALTAEGISTLSLCGALQRKSGLYYGTVSLFPCLGKFFFTDHWVSCGTQDLGHVYELGTDSYSLARLTCRSGYSSALDLCTGSGVHAIHSAADGLQSTAVDINPKALRYTQINAALNSVAVETYEGDLYEALPSATYDLITVNPPFVPTPDRTVLIHRSPGESGEEVSERLVRGLPERLNPNGMFSMILNYPKLKSESYLDRIQRWLDQKTGWVIAVLDLKEMPIGQYIQEQISPVDDYGAEFCSYLESYASQGIEAILLGNVFLIRTGDDRPNHLVQRKTVWPNISRQENLRAWLQAQLEYSAPHWHPSSDWKPAMNPYYKTLWRDRDQSKGILEPQPDNWIPGEELNGQQAELLSRLRGEETVLELKNRWLEDGRSERDFLQTLRELGLLFALH